MISALHTWGRILTVAGGCSTCSPRSAGLPGSPRSLENMPEDRGVWSDPRALLAAEGADPELGRRLRGWLVRQRTPPLPSIQIKERSIGKPLT